MPAARLACLDLVTFGHQHPLIAPFALFSERTLYDLAAAFPLMPSPKAPRLASLTRFYRS